MSTNDFHLRVYVAVTSILGIASFWGQTIEPHSPVFALLLVSGGALFGFTFMGYAGFSLVREKAHGAVLAACVATISVPVLVELILQHNRTPLNPQGRTILAVLFYWTISVVLALLLFAGVFWNLAIDRQLERQLERQNNTAFHPESQ